MVDTHPVLKQRLSSFFSITETLRIESTLCSKSLIDRVLLENKFVSASTIFDDALL